MCSIPQLPLTTAPTPRAPQITHCARAFDTTVAFDHCTHVSVLLHRYCSRSQPAHHPSLVAAVSILFFCRHAQRTILMDLPQHFQSFTLQSAASPEEDMIPRPNLEATVMTRPPLGGCEININPANACATLSQTLVCTLVMRAR